MAYEGDILAGSSIRFKFTTLTTTGAPTTLSGTPVVSVYKVDSTTESVAGVTLTVDFDGRTGLNHVVIDTSADGTFYAAGNDFQAIITTGTVGGTSVVGYVCGEFSIENRTQKSDIRKVAGNAIPTPNVSGVLKVDIVDVLGSAPNALQSGRFDSYIGAMAANVLTAAAINAAAFNGKGDWLTGDSSGITTLLTRVPGTVQPQTGDSYARLGAPTGASISADLAEIEGETDNIGLDTAGVTTLLTRIPGTITPPTNFNLLSIDGSGRVDLGKWLGSVPNALQAGRVDTYLGAIGSAAAQQIGKLIGSFSGRVWYVAKKDSAGNAAIDTNDGKSWDTPFLTIFKAINVGADGDVIRVGAGTFNETTNRTDLSLGHTAAMHLIGMGKGVTIINSTATSATGPCVEVDSSILKDLTVTALLPASTLQFPIGATNSNRPFKPWIENVEVIGLSDGFYFEGNTGAGRYVRLKNVRARSNFDCMNVVDDTPWEIWEGDFKASGAFNSFSRHRAIASAGDGTIHSGKYVVVHDKPGAVYAAAIETGSSLDTDTAEVTIMSGVHLSATCPGGVNAFDLVVNHYDSGPQAKVYVGDVIGSGINGWATNGGAGYSDEDTGSVVYRTSSLKASSTSYVGLVQAATATTVTLGAGASNVDDHYKGQTFKTTGNTGAGQGIVVATSNGTTKQLTLGRPFTTIPDVTTNFVIETTDAAATNSSLQVAVSNPGSGGGGGGVIGGTGTRVITSDSGGVDNLRVLEPDGVTGSSEAMVFAYLTSELVANPLAAPLRGYSITRTDGRWGQGYSSIAMMLDPGSYTVVAHRDNKAPAQMSLVVT